MRAAVIMLAGLAFGCLLAYAIVKSGVLK